MKNETKVVDFSSPRICKADTCDNEIIGPTSKFYCSKTCKEIARRRRRVSSRACPICSQVFFPTSLRRTYCSEDCKVEAQYRSKKKRFNEILFIVKDLEQRFVALRSREEQHIFCSEILKQAKSNNKLRQALTYSGFRKYKLRKTPLDDFYGKFNRSAPKKVISRTSIIIDYNEVNGSSNFYIRLCPAYIPKAGTYIKYLGAYTPRIAEIKKSLFEEILALDDFRYALLVDFGFYEPDLDKALEIKRLMEVSFDFYDFLERHTKYIHGMLPYEYLRKTPRPSINLFCDTDIYID